MTGSDQVMWREEEETLQSAAARPRLFPHRQLLSQPFKTLTHTHAAGQHTHACVQQNEGTTSQARYALTRMHYCYYYIMVLLEVFNLPLRRLMKVGFSLQQPPHLLTSACQYAAFSEALTEICSRSDAWRKLGETKSAWCYNDWHAT